MPWGFSALCSVVHPENEVCIGGVLHRPLWGWTRGDENAPESESCREQSLWLGLEARTLVQVTVCSAASGSLRKRNK